MKNIYINERIGKLVILDIYQKEINGYKRKFAKCKCDCGNVVELRKDRLVDKRFKTPNCGCLFKNKKPSKNKYKDIEGKVFNSFLVLKTTNKGSLCMCKCKDCGKITFENKYSVVNKRKRNCGCNKLQYYKDWSNYINKITNIRILEKTFIKNGTWYWKCQCPCGNIFTAMPKDIASGKYISCGCKRNESISKAKRKDWTNYVFSNGIKALRLAYVKNNTCYWYFKCTCGNTFISIPKDVYSNHTTSCGCHKDLFHENYIAKLLDKYNLKYIRQYSYDDCIYKSKLRFDFAIINNNDNYDDVFCLIEYDGRQHFEGVDIFGGEKEFKECQKRDKIKNNYCKEKEINLIRIPYTYSLQEIENKIIQIKESVETAGCL